MDSNSYLDADISSLKETPRNKIEARSFLFQNKENQESTIKHRNGSALAMSKKNNESLIPHYMRPYSCAGYENEAFRSREFPNLDAKSRQLRRSKFISPKPYRPPQVFNHKFELSSLYIRMQSLN